MATKVDTRLNSYSPAVLSLFRVVFGLMFLLFGTSHVFDWPIPFGVPTGSWPVWYAGVIEVVTGVLITLGLFTRVTAFVLSGMMAVAYFMVHAPGGFLPLVNKGELAVLYCFVFLYMAIAGGGQWSLDYLLRGDGRRALSDPPAVNG